jgi:hypothetical protein
MWPDAAAACLFASDAGAARLWVPGEIHSVCECFVQLEKEDGSQSLSHMKREAVRPTIKGFDCVRLSLFAQRCVVARDPLSLGLAHSAKNFTSS